MTVEQVLALGKSVMDLYGITPFVLAGLAISLVLGAVSHLRGG